MIAAYAPKKAAAPVPAPEEKSEPAPKAEDEDADGEDPDEKFAAMVKDLVKGGDEACRESEEGRKR